jgi:hypothetical protein
MDITDVEVYSDLDRLHCIYLSSELARLHVGTKESNCFHMARRLDGRYLHSPQGREIPNG